MNHSTIQVRDLRSNEVEKAVAILAQAFATDPAMNWIFGCEEAYIQGAPAMFRAITRYCLLYGKVFCSEGLEAVALRRLPDDKKFSFWRALRSGFISLPKRMGNEAFKRLMIFDDLTQKERQKQMGTHPFWYCWCLACTPLEQGKGFGRALMQHTFTLAKNSGLPCYLETATVKNQMLYEKNGFHKLAELCLPNSEIKIIAMIRES